MHLHTCLNGGPGFVNDRTEIGHQEKCLLGGRLEKTYRNQDGVRSQVECNHQTNHVILIKFWLQYVQFQPVCQVLCVS